jgi:hypothetical protein
MLASAASSPDQQQLKAVLLGLAAIRQSIDQLAAAQNQMTNEITKLQAPQQEISMPAPSPAAPPTPKPVSPTSQRAVR